MKRLPRFFVSKERITKGEVALSGSDSKHIKQVLRLKAGDKIKVLSGNGKEYLFRITAVKKNEVKADIIKEIVTDTESNLKVTLVQSLPKPNKMDFIVKSCSELGVAKIIPVTTERTIVRLDSSEKMLVRQIRWQRIAKEAAEQSGRKKVPQICELTSFKLALKECPRFDLSLIPWELEKKEGIKEALQNRKGSKTILILVGPEGGFSLQEIEQAKLAGALPVSLGRRILRSETAGMVTLALVMYEFGDMAA